MNLMSIFLFIIFSAGGLFSEEHPSKLSVTLVETFIGGNAEALQNIAKVHYYKPAKAEEFAANMARGLMDIPPQSRLLLGASMGKYKYVGCVVDGGAYRRDFYIVYHEFAPLSMMVMTYFNGVEYRLCDVAIGDAAGKFITDNFVSVIDAAGRRDKAVQSGKDVRARAEP